MRRNYHIKLISNGEVIDTIALCAFTNYQAKKEVIYDIKNDEYWHINDIELYRNDGKIIKKFAL